MKKKQIVLLLLIPILIIAFLYTSKTQKEKWANEASEIKYSEKREIEVWGKILRGDNPALYYGTPLYDLAEALSGFALFRDDKKIEELITSIPKGSINIQDGKFKGTIGQFALTVGNLKAVRLLLDNGLNPNLIANEYDNGRALIIDINGLYVSNSPENLETLKYMIKKKADVNLFSENNHFSPTPLIGASKMGKLENVKTLVEAGANPHFIQIYDDGDCRSALSEALLNKRIEVVNYLIFEQKVDFRTIKIPSISKFHPGEYRILHSLREMTFELNSKDYKEKMKLVAYLKTQGLDYWKTPIPDKYKTNSNYTPEYLSKY